MWWPSEVQDVGRPFFGSTLTRTSCVYSDAPSTTTPMPKQLKMSMSSSVTWRLEKRFTPFFP